MKRITIICCMALALAVPLRSAAQGSKQVEVTKVYVPQVGDAQKPAIAVDLTDTVRMRPDIDYSITPHTWQTSLKMRDFNPATATYWDYNRPKLFYARLAAGYPLTTAGDLYLTTHNPKTGYVGVYLNHEGDFQPRSTVTGEKLSMGRSSSMHNRAGVRGGVYAGRHMAEIDLDYNNDMFHRYAVPSAPRLQYDNMGGSVRFGDDFADLSRVNFNVELHGRYRRDCHVEEGEQSRNLGRFGGSFALAREIGRNRIDFSVGYDEWLGRKALADYGDRQATVALRYSRMMKRSTLSVGLGYKYDKIKLRESALHFVMPSLRWAYDRRSAAFAPYVEIETSVTPNDFQSLVERNPYIGFDARTAEALLSMPSTRSYDAHVGFTGVTARGRLAYRAYVGVSFIRNQVFWYNYDMAWFGAETDDNNRIVFDAEIEYRPIGALTLSGGVRIHGDNTDSDLYCSDPDIAGEVGIRYKHRRFVISAGVEVLGSRKWSVVNRPILDEGYFSTPVTADVSLGFDWIIDSRWTVCVEGRNLANMKLYDWAAYYRNSINFQAGVKINF